MEVNRSEHNFYWHFLDAFHEFIQNVSPFQKEKVGSSKRALTFDIEKTKTEIIRRSKKPCYNNWLP